MFLSSSIEDMVKEVQSKVVLRKIRKHGYEVIRIRPGLKKRIHTNRFKSLLFPLIRQRNRGGDKW